MAQRASELLRLARSLDPNGFRHLLEGAELKTFLETAEAVDNGMDDLSEHRLDALLAGQPCSHAARRQLADVAG
jgi:hypothetical protein